MPRPAVFRSGERLHVVHVPGASLAIHSVKCKLTVLFDELVGPIQVRALDPVWIDDDGIRVSGVFVHRTLALQPIREEWKCFRRVCDWVARRRTVASTGQVLNCRREGPFSESRI
jgi:hypothetical protein